VRGGLSRNFGRERVEPLSEFFEQPYLGPWPEQLQPQIANIMNWIIVANSVIYAFLGVFIFCLAFFVVDKITPFELWKELVEKQNTALAIVVGLGALGICVIVAAAIH
jgi:putative membrane protein